MILRSVNNRSNKLDEIDDLTNALNRNCEKLYCNNTKSAHYNKAKPKLVILRSVKNRSNKFDEFDEFHDNLKH